LSSYGCLERGRQRNRGFFSGMVRGVSDPREGSKMLTFLFRSRLVCSSLTSPKLVEDEFCELRSGNLRSRDLGSIALKRLEA
jgi:hypothetical protein